MHGDCHLRLVLVAVLAFGSCGPGSGAEREPLILFAAASLTEAVSALAEEYENAEGRPVRVNFAASSVLARQIAAGAPADVFLSAHPDWIDYLVENGRAAAADRVVFAANRLALVVPRGRRAPAALAELKTMRRIALADPEAVPAGIYARKMLQAAGLWAEVKPRVIPALDVRAALKLAEMGAVDAALVYRTDAARSAAVVEADVVPAALTPEIRYAAVITTRGQSGSKAAAARGFLRYLTGPDGARRLSSFGFIPLARAGAPR